MKDQKIKCKSFAKINLSLDVKGIREDGYHEVEMVMHGIELCDEVSISWREGEPKGIIIGCNLPYVPKDDRNIAYQAAQMMMTHFGMSGSVRIDILKRVPVSAGLAGGSGNAAAVCLALAAIWKTGAGFDELLRLGAGLGADVPFSMMCQAKRQPELGFSDDPQAGYAAIARGTGTDLEKIEPMDALLVLAKPPISVSTREAYAGIDGMKAQKRPDAEALAEDMRRSDFDAMAENMANILEVYTLCEYDRVRELKDRMRSLSGPDGITMMTGSGPTIYTLLPPEDEETARSVSEELQCDLKEVFASRTMI